MSDRPRTYEQWEVEQLVDSKVREALEAYDKQLLKFLEREFIIKLSKHETAYKVQIFVVAAVVMLLIGTAYQMFISLANQGGLK